MSSKQYRSLATFGYSRKIKSLVPGKVRNMRFKGQRVKILMDKTGRKLSVIEAPKSALAEIRKAETLRVDDGALRPIYKQPAVKPKPEPERPKPSPAPKAEPPVEPATVAQPPLKPTKKVEATKGSLTDADRRKAALVPVPDKGPIPAPYIDWDEIPENCKISGIQFMDYSNKYNSEGWLSELREAFRRGRHQGRVPINVLISGPPGTGKSELIRKFAEDSGLPYWGVIGREGIRSDELLGSYALKEGTSRWIDGIIPKAVRAGGILHFDEPNLIDGAVLQRLDELMDNKRQLDMRDINGPLVKAHPDLFIVFTMNPSGSASDVLKALPPAVLNRLKPVYKMDYPPREVELRILKWKMGLNDNEFKMQGSGASGAMARDITDFMKIVDGLRKQTDLSYMPSLRDTQYFVQSLKEGDSFFKAFDTSLKDNYWGEEADRIEEALSSVRRR